MTNIAIILAGGTGERFININSDLPKQYNRIAETSIFAMSLSQFLYHKEIDFVLPVIHKKHSSFYANVLQEIGEMGSIKILPAIFGGSNRMFSSIIGWMKIDELVANDVVGMADKILVHDVVRPFISSSLISEVLKALDIYDVVDVGIDLVDTIKYKKNRETSGSSILNRESLYGAQTPQGMRYSKLRDLYRTHYMPLFSDLEIAVLDSLDLCFSDDVSFCMYHNTKLSFNVVKGTPSNFKITSVDDLQYAKFLATILKKF